MDMQILHGLLNSIAMQDISTPISSCRHCRFYCPEGRRGGECGKLNVNVQGAWRACALAEPPFETVAEEQEKTPAEVTAEAPTVLSPV